MSYYGNLYQNEELSHRAKTVYMYLHDRSDAAGACWPGVKRIASDLKLSRQHGAAGFGRLGAGGTGLAPVPLSAKRQPDQQSVSDRRQKRKKLTVLRQGGTVSKCCHEGSAHHGASRRTHSIRDYTTEKKQLCRVTLSNTVYFLESGLRVLRQRNSSAVNLQHSYLCFQ